MHTVRDMEGLYPNEMIYRSGRYYVPVDLLYYEIYNQRHDYIGQNYQRHVGFIRNEILRDYHFLKLQEMYGTE